VRLADAGLDLARSWRTIRPDRRRHAGDRIRQLIASATDSVSQLIKVPMVTIFLRSLVYNVLFYALLVFWILVRCRPS